MGIDKKKVEYLVVDTTAFIQNAALHEVAEKMVTCREVVDEITNRRQLRRLITLPYDLEVKDVDPENIKVVTDFSLKTGDYPSLSATDIKVIALTYQLEKEKMGIEHLRTEPLFQRTVNVHKKLNNEEPTVALPGFYLPGSTNGIKLEDDQEEESGEEEDEERGEEDDQEEEESGEEDEEEQNIEKDNENSPNLIEKFTNLKCSDDIKTEESEKILARITEKLEESDKSEDSDEDDDGWITPANVKSAKRQFNSEILEEKRVVVACMTTDFAMQNVLKQINLNVAALDGRMIKQLRTFILRCYSCFKTTSIMTKRFCPKCGNDTLKKVAVSLDENGKMQIHINGRKPLSGRGKKFSLPRIKGGKHPNNPILVADQPMPHNKPTKLGRTTTNALDDDYIAGFSPFATRDVTSKAAQLGIRPGTEIKYFMRKNPNEVRKKRK